MSITHDGCAQKLGEKRSCASYQCGSDYRRPVHLALSDVSRAKRKSSGSNSQPPLLSHTHPLQIATICTRSVQGPASVVGAVVVLVEATLVKGFHAVVSRSGVTGVIVTFYLQAVATQ